MSSVSPAVDAVWVVGFVGGLVGGVVGGFVVGTGFAVGMGLAAGAASAVGAVWVFAVATGGLFWVVCCCGGGLSVAVWVVDAVSAVGAVSVVGRWANRLVEPLMGALVRLIPTPTMAKRLCFSTKTPPTFAPFNKISLGHFRRHLFPKRFGAGWLEVSEGEAFGTGWFEVSKGKAVETSLVFEGWLFEG